MIMRITATPEITRKAQEGIDRFAELIEEYKRMKGVHGDTLQLGDYDLYTGVLADAMHWAMLLGIDPVLAWGEAYRTVLEENVQE